ncbi:MAG: aldose epimerase [Thermoleophilia bacterium]|nr:aldose epimerase [Thermoleophilia bacterium]
MSASTPPTGQQFTIRHGDDHATAVELGGGIRSYVADGRELLDGYDEHEPVGSSRGQVLAPWPNRVDGGCYEWEGAQHQLPLTEPARGNASHGLLRFVSWRCTEHRPAAVTLAATVLPQPGYPFALAVTVRYELDAGGLHVTTTARNIGSAALPWASGQHPYLAAPDGGMIDGCSVELRAATMLPSDERGIPLAPEPTRGTPFDLRELRRIGDLQLDTAFTDLARDADGMAAVRLRGPDGRGAELTADRSYGWIQLFTGDTLPAARRRRGLAVEPMTAPANAFRSGTDLVRLEPGASTASTWHLRALAPS